MVKAKGMKVTGAGPTCKCTPAGLVWLVIGVVVVALGLWAIIKAIQMQWGAGGAFSWNLIFWYSLGLIVLLVGKMLKCKACPACFR